MTKRNKKLLLILPRSERSYYGTVSKAGKAGIIRLALPTIAALTPSDWDIEILDSRVKPVDFKAKADLVGITGFTSEIPHAYSIADGFRAKGTKVVMGGVHVSALPEEALTHADAVVISEAELVWNDLLKDLEKGELKRTYKSENLTAMGGYSLPRKDLLNRKMYNSGFNSLQATRGCPFDCGYCAVTVFFGHKFRTRPIHEVVDEIRHFDSKYFFFMDDNIIGMPGYAKELFTELLPLKRTWGSQASITLARDEKLLELYAKCGGRYAFIGLESLSEANLKDVNKSWNSPKNYKEAIARIHDAGINVIGSFVFGLDNDDKDVFKRTFEFIMDNNLAAAQFHILTPLPGTRLYEELEKEGRIIDRDWAKYHTGEVVFRPKNMNAEELQRGYYWIHKETYRFRNMLKRCIRKPVGLAYRIAANVNYRKKADRMPEVKSVANF